jgi:hypothetical protein
MNIPKPREFRHLNSKAHNEQTDDRGELMYRPHGIDVRPYPRAAQQKPANGPAHSHRAPLERHRTPAGVVRMYTGGERHGRPQAQEAPQIGRVPREPVQQVPE